MKAIVSDTINITVPFFDCDPMAICWHGHYTKYLELARCQLFEKIDYSYMRMHESGYTWPIIDLQIHYIQPIRYEQQLEIHAALVEYEHYIKIEYVIFDKASGKRLTKAMTKQVAVASDSGEMQFVSPSIIHEKLVGYL